MGFFIKTYILCPRLKGVDSPRSVDAQKDEVFGLAQAVDLDVLGVQSISLAKYTPATLMGSGLVDELKALFASLDVALVIVDHALSPVQQRNLERTWKVKVIDRTGLILEIFGKRARTAEGVLQVELAALQYQRSRLVRSWTHLERQRGGFGFIGGPGESQIELDRRIIDDRIVKIKKELAKTVRTRRLQRKARHHYPTVALVGYTNSGKSTLFNALTKADVFAQDLLFATLDPTMRQLKLPSGTLIIISDTVGFISELPTTLVAAFRATLEEVIHADLILHVRDIHHEDSDVQKNDVEYVLKELGLEEIIHQDEILEVWNKIDLISHEMQEILQNKSARVGALTVSALQGEGLDRLKKTIDLRLKESMEEFSVTIPSARGDILAWCYAVGGVIERKGEEEHVHLTLRLPPSLTSTFWSMLRG